MKLRMVSLDSKEAVEELEILSIHLSKGFSVSPDQLSLALSLRNHLSPQSVDDVIFYFMNPSPQNPLPNDGCDTTMLMNVAVQLNAVLLDFGFVGFDPVLCTKLDGFRLPDRFPSSAPILHYTTPQLLSCSKSVQTVSIRFQRLGKKFVNVFGYLSNNNSKDKGFIYMLCLDGSRIVQAIIKFDLPVNERVINDLWKDVKDCIAFPLLIDLCQSVGLVPPTASFMLLPDDLKLKILGLLRGDYVVKVACVCHDLKSVSSDNAMWGHKFRQEFPVQSLYITGKDPVWKPLFSGAWKRRQYELKRKMDMVRGHRDQGTRPRKQPWYLSSYSIHGFRPYNGSGYWQ